MGHTGLVLLGACAPDSPVPTSVDRDARLSLARADYDQPGAHRQYGPPTKVGNGMARAYVVLDSRHGEAPLELGIALDARALQGLPSAQMMYMYLLKLPALAPEPYKLVELDWNPHGHEPPNVYTFPHFDSHFYTISLAERNSIVPSNPDFAAEANNLPTGAFVPPFYAALAGPGQTPADIAVPQMGVHWSDVRSPELQALLGNPAGAVHEDFHLRQLERSLHLLRAHGDTGVPVVESRRHHLHTRARVLSRARLLPDVVQGHVRRAGEGVPRGSFGTHQAAVMHRRRQ